MKPTVGRVVHFFNMSLPANAVNGMGPGPYAAIVTQVFSEHCVSLHVFRPDGNRDESSVMSRSGADAVRFWDWPQREGDATLADHTHTGPKTPEAAQ